jgi:hypothetical protein
MNVQFNYVISPGIYRKMLYFNAFFSGGVRSFFILPLWILAAISLILDICGIIQPSRVMHLCFLLVSVSAPLLVFGIEMKIRQGGDGDFFARKRTVVFTADGIDYRIDGTKNPEGDIWDDVVVHETKTLLIIVRDRRYAVPVPKAGQSQGIGRRAPGIKRETGQTIHLS